MIERPALNSSLQTFHPDCLKNVTCADCPSKLQFLPHRPNIWLYRKWLTTSVFQLSVIGCGASEVTHINDTALEWLLSLQFGSKLFTRLPQSMPNADHCRSMPINIMALNWFASQCGSLPINADQFQSAWSGIDRHWSALIGIDRNWSTLESMPQFWLPLISIGHWSRESCINPTNIELLFMACTDKKRAKMSLLGELFGHPLLSSLRCWCFSY